MQVPRLVQVCLQTQPQRLAYGLSALFLLWFYTWFCMTTSGLMILEANLHYPTGSSFDTIVKDLLGKGWNIINGLSVAFVLYILTYAYITSGGGITQNLLNQAFGSAESAVDIDVLLDP